MRALRRPAPRLGSALLVSVLLGAGLSACAQDDDETTTLTVHAAASLQSSFEEIGAEFESAHDDVEVVFNFAGSSDLVAQIQQGAAGDVFASADEAQMERLVSEDLVAGAPVPFATNTLQIVVAAGNPAGIGSLADLVDPDLDVVVCAPQVPCGAAAVRAEKSAGIDLRPVSEEQSVTDVLAKVVLGEADAGLVYVTDVKRAGDKVEGVDFAESDAALNVYPVAALDESTHSALATDFVDLVTSAFGRQVLAEAGFGAP